MKQLLEKLMKYVHHDHTCPHYYKSKYMECECGLDGILKAIEDFLEVK